MMDVPFDLIGNSVSRGDILLSEFEGIEHKKYFVVMGVSEDKICGFFFINSNINERVFYGKQELLNLQYPIYEKDYKFLRYQSFINAANLRKRVLSEIANGIQCGSIKVVDRLKDEHIADIIEAVRNSKVISKRDKDMFFK